MTPHGRIALEKKGPRHSWRAFSLCFLSRGIESSAKGTIPFLALLQPALALGMIWEYTGEPWETAFVAIKDQNMPGKARRGTLGIFGGDSSFLHLTCLFLGVLDLPYVADCGYGLFRHSFVAKVCIGGVEKEVCEGLLNGFKVLSGPDCEQRKDGIWKARLLSQFSLEKAKNQPFNQRTLASVVMGTLPIFGFRLLAKRDWFETRYGQDDYDKEFDFSFRNTKMTTGHACMSMQNSWWPYAYPMELILGEFHKFGWRPAGGQALVLFWPMEETNP